MMKFILILLSFIPLSLIGQTEKFVDARDNQTYETIIVDSTLWMRDYLRYNSSQSKFYTHKFKDSEVGVSYYSNLELDSICPENWHVATIDNWENLIEVLVKEKNFSSNDIKYDTIVNPNNSIFVTINNLELLSDTLLNLFAAGWVQGGKLRNKKTLNLWINNLSTGDSKYHVHASDGVYIKHSHDHNIIDKPKRTRKFPVRCVCDSINGFLPSQE